MLTTEVITTLAAPEKGNKIVYDGHGGVPGFGLRITTGGARSYIVGYRTKGGIERRQTIGDVKVWGANPKKAREEAKRILRIVDGGGDPLGEQRAARQTPTVLDLAVRAIEDHFSKKSLSLRDDVYGPDRFDDKGNRIIGGQMGRWILPEIGSLKVAAVRPADIESLHRKITKAGSPIRANRCVSTLSRMFALAIRWGLRTDGVNPCRHAVDANPETRRERYLRQDETRDELTRLTTALAAYPDQAVADALRMLLLTGARPDEVLAARFDQFDGALWTKQVADVKQRRIHRVQVSAPVLEIVARRRAAATGEHLFPGRDRPHLTNIYRSWRSIKMAAKLENFRIYDLRHSAASFLVSGGKTLPVIGAILGHSKSSTTQRYAHLLPNAQQAAVDQLASIVTQAPSAEVVKFRKA